MLSMLKIDSDASDQEDTASGTLTHPPPQEVDKQAKTIPDESRVVCPQILHGDPLTDRKSTFQAHGAEVKTPEEVS